jgi:hypothetical protein
MKQIRIILLVFIPLTALIFFSVQQAAASTAPIGRSRSGASEDRRIFGMIQMAALCRDAATPIADDAAASGAPERFAFPAGANVAPAFGHDAAGMGEISMPIMVREFSRGRRTIQSLSNDSIHVNHLNRGTRLPWAPQYKSHNWQDTVSERAAGMILLNWLNKNIFKKYPIRIKTLLWATRVLTLAPIASLSASTTVQTSQTES